MRSVLFLFHLTNHLPPAPDINPLSWEVNIIFTIFSECGHRLPRSCCSPLHPHLSFAPNPKPTAKEYSKEYSLAVLE